MGNGSDDMVILLVVICMAVSVILLILIIALWVKLNKIRSSYAKMINGSGVSDLQGIISDIQNKLNQFQSDGQHTKQDLQELQQRLATFKGNLAFTRYNAFNDHGHGSDLSFSLALLDDSSNGVVLTAIHGRDETYIYGKPITNGESKYPLTPEERQMIQTAEHRQA